MGLEILEEFWPIKPIRTGTSGRTLSHRTQQSDPADDTTNLKGEEEEEQECHTPTSPSQTLTSTTPLVCPPPPKKPRVARRTNLIAPSSSSSQSQSQGGFFQVPHDLASVFVLQQSPKPPTFPTTPRQAALC